MSNDEVLKSGKDVDEMDVVLACARAAHEVNRAYCIAIGDHSQIQWDDAPRWQRDSCVDGVRGVIAGNGPRESHEQWLVHKRDDGWKYGPVKNVEKKEHPCFVPYDALPPEQQKKDKLFVTTVIEMLTALKVENLK